MCIWAVNVLAVSFWLLTVPSLSLLCIVSKVYCTVYIVELYLYDRALKSEAVKSPEILPYVPHVSCGKAFVP